MGKVNDKKMSTPKITIAIPAHNNEKHIKEAIESALAQEYPLKEILVADDFSSDSTYAISCSYADKGVKTIRNSSNLGIGKNLENLMQRAEGRYIIYLCADDIFASPKVVSDVVKVFDNNRRLGMIGRYYYYFLDGKPGAIGVCRDKNILIHSCCPSGMAFRKRDDIVGTNKIYVEMPSIVAQYLHHCEWTVLEYDTVGARFHPGGNTGTKESYYTESPTQNWIDLLGQNYQDFPMFVVLKNRAPHLLWREICLHVKNDRSVLSNFSFWKYAMIAVMTPSSILRRMTLYYRNRIARRNVSLIERPLGGI